MEEFAKTLPKRGPQCWACSLPEKDRKRIEAARAANPSKWTYRALAEFMRLRMGLPEASYPRLREHFRNHVEAPNG